MTSTSHRSQSISIPGCDNLLPAQIAEIINKQFLDVASDIPSLDLSRLPAFLPSQHPPPTVQPWEVFRELEKVKSGKSSGPDGVPSRLIKTFAYELSDPLCMILNSSFSEGKFPPRWKKAMVVPIPKEQPARINRLRPIALTDHFAKIGETFVSKWIMEDVVSNIDTKQFGNRSGRSTNHCVVDIVNFLARNADRLKATTTVITTDFTSAFDRVDHTIATSKLILSGCRPGIVPWVIDFLTDRTQCVRYLDKVSPWAPVTAGVPQGTRLAPILFLMLNNDALLSSELEHWKYVDDMTIAETRNRGAASEVQNTLSDLHSWCETNNMRMNTSKCHVMVIDFGKAQLPPAELRLGEQVLNEVEVVKVLGLLLQANLKWDEQVNAMVSKVNKRIFMLRTLKQFNLPCRDLMLVYTGYIRPVVEYGVPVWHPGLSKQHTARLERVQKRALKLILGTQYVSYAQALHVTKLKSLESRRHDLCLRFAQALQNSPEFSDWLPSQRQNKYQNSLRRVTTYPEIKCRTDRYKRSPIPYFVRLLNEK